MTNARIIAGDLTANLAERTVTGLLLPYGEVGSTNLGRFSVDAGIFTIPEDVTVLNANLEHSQMHPVARFTSAVETAAGIVASFAIAKGPEGDDLLAEIEDAREKGRMKALSAEVRDVVIRAGKALSGVLTGAAFVERGAFPSASLLAAAFDTPEAEPEQVQTAPPQITESEVDEDTEPEAPAEEEEDDMPAASAPSTLAASAKAKAKSITKSQVFELLAARSAGRASADMLAKLADAQGVSESALFAALSDITYDAADDTGEHMIGLPQWIGELWSGVTYRQKVLPLFGHANLTGLKIDGWRWVTKPEGGTWTGNKTAIPSNVVVTEPYEEVAQRFAGGHDHAIEHRHFNTPGYFESYFAAMSESYAQWADETVVLADVLAAAVDVEADNPAGLTIGAGMSAIIDGAARVIDANALPSFAIVEAALYKSILKTPDNATLGYLNAALGLEDGTLESFRLIPSSLLPAGNVLVGAKEAATVYELPGVPIRVEGLDIARGGVDTAVFGYAGTVIHKADALVQITPYTP